MPEPIDYEKLDALRHEREDQQHKLTCKMVESLTRLAEAMTTTY